MIVPAQLLRAIKPVEPFVERSVEGGMSYGLSAAGYDVRVAEDIYLEPGDFTLASTLERFITPPDLVGIVHDKSTWARLGLAVQNTVIEPGWQGYLTLELTNHGHGIISIAKGMPIAQIVYHKLMQPTEQPYQGKYQNQEQGAQEARFE